MKTTHVYLLLLCISLMNLQCKKDKSYTKVTQSCTLYSDSCELAKLPPITFNAEVTFGCLVNRKAWLPDTCCGNNSAPSMHMLHSDYSVSTGTYYLGTHQNLFNDTALTTSISMEIRHLEWVPKTYELSDFNSQNTSSGRYNFCLIPKSCEPVEYNTSTDEIGRFEVLFIDSLAQIISGVFEFSGISDKNEIVHITHGRFDTYFEYN